MPAAVNLLSRAAELLPQDDPLRVQLLPDLAFALLETGDFARMQVVVAEVSERVKGSDDSTLEAQAVILRLWTSVLTNPEGWAEEASRQATAAISMFEEQHDDRGLAKAWSLLGLVHVLTCQFATSEGEWERAAEHAHAAGQEREELEYLSWIPLVVWGGPTPVEQGMLRCAEVLGRASGDRKAMSTALFTMAKFEAMRGRFQEARDLIARSRSILEEVSLPVLVAGPLAQMSGWVEILAGDPAAAERELQPAAKTLQDIGELTWLSTVAGILAEAVWAQGRQEDAEKWLVVAEEAAGTEDVYSQSLVRGIRAKLAARRGNADEAERMGRESVAIAAPTDFLFIQAYALLSLGEAMMETGRKEPAAEILNEALNVCERKGFMVGADQARRLLATA